VPPLSEPDAGGAGGEGGAEAVAELPAIEPAPATRTREEYCAAQAELREEWCDYIDSCCSELDRADLYFIPGACSDGHADVNDCLTTLADLELRGVKWDGGAVDECIASLVPLYPAAPVSCQGLDLARWADDDRGLHGYSQQPACRRMVRGTKVQGSVCEYQSECQPGFVCSPSNLDDLSQPYVCLPEGERGAPCISDSQCHSDLFCVGVGDRRCGDLMPLGGECLYSSECDLGLSCSLLGKCAQVVGLGATCDELHVCSIDLGCSFSTKTCVAIPKIGEACDSSCDGRCENGQCVATCGGTLL
jgi:hypothetical protein